MPNVCQIKWGQNTIGFLWKHQRRSEGTLNWDPGRSTVWVNLLERFRSRSSQSIAMQFEQGKDGGHRVRQPDFDPGTLDKTHLLTAVPSTSPNSLCWLWLVSTGLSWINKGSDWGSGLVQVGCASGFWSWSSVRWWVLVSLGWNRVRKFRARSFIPGGEVPEDVPEDAVGRANRAKRRYW